LKSILNIVFKVFSPSLATIQQSALETVGLLLSGTLTTWIALNSFVLIMAHHQDVQRRLFQAVSSRLGVDRLPSVSDRDGLDMMEATVLELLRYISHVPLGLPHFTTDDTSVAGFLVKKHTKVTVLSR